MKKRCENCWFWEYAQSDDANERYGQCHRALSGENDAAYPWSAMVIRLNGPQHHTEFVWASLLTRADHYCHDWEEETCRV